MLVVGDDAGREVVLHAVDQLEHLWELALLVRGDHLEGAEELGGRWRRYSLWGHLPWLCHPPRTAAPLATAARLEGAEELGGGGLECLLAPEDRVDGQVDRGRLHRAIAGGDAVALQRLASEGERGAWVRVRVRVRVRVKP